MKKGLLIALLSTAIVLVACGTAETKKDPVETTAEVTTTSTITTTEPAESIDAGLESIDVMLDYLATGDKDGAIEKLQGLQTEINDEKDPVSGFINIFLADIAVNADKDSVIEDIHLMEDYLGEHTPN